MCGAKHTVFCKENKDVYGGVDKQRQCYFYGVKSVRTKYDIRFIYFKIKLLRM